MSPARKRSQRLARKRAAAQKANRARIVAAEYKRRYGPKDGTVISRDKPLDTNSMKDVSPIRRAAIYIFGS